MLSDHTWHEIESIDTSMRSCKVYNLEVSRNHNYYVGTHGVLVHNKEHHVGENKTITYRSYVK